MGQKPDTGNEGMAAIAPCRGQGSMAALLAAIG